jgi:hypothetical protein
VTLNQETAMDANNNPNQPEALTSTEYRARLATKLNCLIAVLEVAIAKIGRSLEVPGANEERLRKIRGNLENTLSICNRAKQTLERSQPVAKAQRAPTAEQMSARDYVELSSIDEYRKFRKMTPIEADEIRSIDFDELTRKLLGS